MQFQHLLAAILYIRYKGTLRRKERDDEVRLFPLQQCRERLSVLTSFPQISHNLPYRTSAVVIGVVDAQVHQPHLFRKRIERRPAVLVGSHDGDVPVRLMLPEPHHLVEQDALHPAGIIKGMYAIDEFHECFFPNK